MMPKMVRVSAWARPHPQNAPREGEHPQNGQAGENAAEGHFLDGLPHVGGLEGRRLQKWEHAGHAGRLQEVGEERRGQTTDVHAALGHVVHRQVIVRAEIGQRAEARVVVGHDARGHQNVGGRQAGELHDAPAGGQPGAR